MWYQSMHVLLDLWFSNYDVFFSKLCFPEIIIDPNYEFGNFMKVLIVIMNLEFYVIINPNYDLGILWYYKLYLRF